MLHVGVFQATPHGTVCKMRRFLNGGSSVLPHCTCFSSFFKSRSARSRISTDRCLYIRLLCWEFVSGEALLTAPLPPRASPLFVFLFCVRHVVTRRYFANEASAFPLSHPPFPNYLCWMDSPWTSPWHLLNLFHTCLFIYFICSFYFILFFFRSRSVSARITTPATRLTWPMPRG